MTILGPLAEKVEKNILILHTFSEDKKVFHFIIPFMWRASRPIL